MIRRLTEAPPGPVIADLFLILFYSEMHDRVRRILFAFLNIRNKIRLYAVGNRGTQCGTIFKCNKQHICPIYILFTVLIRYTVWI